MRKKTNYPHINDNFEQTVYLGLNFTFCSYLDNPDSRKSHDDFRLSGCAGVDSHFVLGGSCHDPCPVHYRAGGHFTLAQSHRSTSN